MIQVMGAQGHITFNILSTYKLSAFLLTLNLPKKCPQPVGGDCQTWQHRPTTTTSPTIYWIKKATNSTHYLLTTPALLDMHFRYLHYPSITRPPQPQPPQFRGLQTLPPPRPSRLKSPHNPLLGNNVHARNLTHGLIQDHQTCSGATALSHGLGMRNCGLHSCCCPAAPTTLLSIDCGDVC